MGSFCAPLGGHLTVSADIFDFHGWWCNWHLEARDTAKYPTRHGTAFPPPRGITSPGNRCPGLAPRGPSAPTCLLGSFSGYIFRGLHRALLTPFTELITVFWNQLHFRTCLHVILEAPWAWGLWFGYIMFSDQGLVPKYVNLFQVNDRCQSELGYTK